MEFHFMPLAVSHFDLLLDWLNKPHIKRWWDSETQWTSKLIKSKYTTYTQGYKIEGGIKKPINAFIILLGTQPIGYIQIYNAYNFPRTKPLTGLPKNLAAFDMFIGNDHILGKSIGSQALIIFLKSFCDRKYTHIFADPDKDNIGAIKCYQKAGFKFIEDHTEVNESWFIKVNDSFVDDFFRNYSKAFIEGEIQVLLSFYKFPCTLIHKNKKLLFNHKNFSHNLRSLIHHYQEHYLYNARFDIDHINLKDDFGIEVDVKWALIDTNNDVFSQFTCTYHLINDLQDGFKIVQVNNLNEMIS